MDRAARSGFAMVLVAPLPYVALQLIHANDMLPPTSLIGALWMLLLSALLGYPAVALIGVPVHLFLLKRGWTHIFIYALLAAAVTFGFQRLLIGFMRTSWTFLQDKTEVGVYSVIGGALFWLIARPDRPDKPRASQLEALPNVALLSTKTKTEPPPLGSPKP